MQQRLLITGGAGFIGVNLVDYFLKKSNYKITVLDNLSASSFDTLSDISKSNGIKIVDNNELSENTLIFIQGDIRDKKTVETALEGQDIIIHLAAETGVIPSVQDPNNDADVNIFGTLNLLNSAVKCKVKKFIFASSAAPLGDQIPPNNEKMIAQPMSPYGASKLAAEGYCSAFFNSYGLNTTVLRFSNVYGPKSFHKGSVVSLFIKKILNDEDLEIYGDGTQTRDYLFVEDIALAMEKVINSKSASGELFQLGTEVETSINTLLDLLKRVINIKFNIVYRDKRAGEIDRNFTDISKIKNLLNYEAKISLVNGLKTTWDWFKKKNNIPKL